MTLKPPVLPKKFQAATLTQEILSADDEEYHHLRFDGGSFDRESVDYLRFQQVEFQAVRLENSRLLAPRLTDVRLQMCSLTNTTCEQIISRRVEFINCQLLGWNSSKGHFQDVLFRGCDIQLSLFRFCTFKSVRFEECDLKDASFQGANLAHVIFKQCNLSNVELSQSQLVGADFRTSNIEGLRVGAQEVRGAIVDHFQAAYLASLLGLIVKNEDEA